MTSVEQAKEAHELELMAIPGVEGVGIGSDEIGNPAITVYVSDRGAASRLPGRIEGYRVIVEDLGGPIEAQPERP